MLLSLLKDLTVLSIFIENMGTKHSFILNIIILSTTTAKKSVDQFCRCDGFNQISLVKCSLRNRMNGMCEEAISHRLIITTFNKSRFTYLIIRDCFSISSTLYVGRFFFVKIYKMLASNCIT